MQSRITFTSSTLEEVLEAWCMERLSAVEDNIQIIRVSHHPASIWKQALTCSEGRVSPSKRFFMYCPNPYVSYTTHHCMGLTSHLGSVHKTAYMKVTGGQDIAYNMLYSNRQMYTILPV